MRHFLRSTSIPALPVSVAATTFSGALILAPRACERSFSRRFPAPIGAIRLPPVAPRAEPKRCTAARTYDADKLSDFLALPIRTWEKPSERHLDAPPGVPADRPNQSGHSPLCAKS